MNSPWMSANARPAYRSGRSRAQYDDMGSIGIRDSVFKGARKDAQE